MKRIRTLKVIILLLAMVILVTAAGCGAAEKVKTLKDDLVNITMDQVAVQLENSLNQQFPGVQVNSPQVINNKGQVDWGKLKQTELGNYVFYTIGDYEFKAVLNGDGVFKIQRINRATNAAYSFAEFKVERVNGKFAVSAK